MSEGLQRVLGPVAAVLVLAAPVAWAQDAPVRLRGTIERVDGEIYFVKSRDGGEIKLKLAPNGGVSAVVPATLADVKQGKYIGVAALPMADGTQKALEVTIFPEQLRGLAEGFRPWDLQPKSTMTNANVEAIVESTDGQTLTLKYKDGEKKIVVPPGIPIVTFAPAEVSEIKPGARIFVGAAKKLPDGTFETTRINVGRGVAPPM
jgi:hypothetical protein